MNSLITYYCHLQLVTLLIPGGKARVEHCYAVSAPGDREAVTHSFAKQAVGDFNRQKEAVLYDKLTAGLKITMKRPPESFIGNRKHNGLPTPAKVMSTDTSVRSSSLIVDLGK